MSALRNSTYVHRRYSLDDYFDLLERSTIRLEYVAGYIYAMTGASREHIQINSNLHGEFYIRLKGTDCSVSSNDMQVGVQDETGEEAYVFPDLTISCQPEDLRRVNKRDDVLFNPLAVFEVLSSSNEDYDQKTKLNLYQAIPSLVDIVYVRQDRIEVAHWTRKAKTWQLTTYTSLEDTMTIMGCTVRLQDVYRGLTF
jgi:Uma2 family endonuclease